MARFVFMAVQDAKYAKINWTFLGSFLGLFFSKDRRIAFDSLHRLAVIDFLVANGAFVILQIRDNISFALNLTCPIPPHFFDFVAAAGWADRYFYHSFSFPLKT